MVDPTMDMLGWLRNQIQAAEPDLLREMVQTFAEALTGGRGRCPVRCRLRAAKPRAHQPPKRIPRASLGHPRRHDRAGRAQAALG